MVEETVSVEKASKNNSPDFGKKFGTLNRHHFYKTQEAIRNGDNISIVSPGIAFSGTIIRGDEIKAWGLDINSLLVNNEMEAYEREIL